MKFKDENRAKAIEEIKKFFFEEFEMDLGDLKSELVLDFCAENIGPYIYNQAVSDAQAFMQERVSDMDGVLYEPEPTDSKKGRE